VNNCAPHSTVHGLQWPEKSFQPALSPPFSDAVALPALLYSKGGGGVSILTYYRVPGDLPTRSCGALQCITAYVLYSIMSTGWILAIYMHKDFRLVLAPD
jgi:hypothetical protein